MSGFDFIIISQSEMIDYGGYSRLPVDRIALFEELIYPRMVFYKGGFHSHLDLLNGFSRGTFWEDAGYERRRGLLNIWNLPGFSGIHLACRLKQVGVSTLVINNFDAEWDILREGYEQSSPPPLVGISTTFHLGYSELKRISGRLRKEYPDVRIVIGGAFVSGRMLNGDPAPLAKAMKKYSIDYALHGFNPEPDIASLLLWNKTGTPPIEEVNNLIYLSRDSGGGRRFSTTKTVWNPPALDDAPLRLEDLNLHFLNRTIQTRTSSGCPFSCAFCSYPRSARGHHVMPPELVEENIRNIKKMGNIDNIIFIDDTLNVPAPRFKKLLEIFASLDFEWFSFLRAQFIDDETASLMKNSGCKGVYLGIESANDAVLKNMDKRATRDKFARGIESLKKRDITTMAAFVLGFPGETEETLNDNVRFIETTGVDFYTLKEFYYMENTPVHEKRELYNLTGAGNKWAHETMDYSTAHKHKIEMFKRIKNSVFVDPDTSLWYLAYLYDKGFSMKEIADMQRDIVKIMAAQIDGEFDDEHPAFDSLKAKLKDKS